MKLREGKLVQAVWLAAMVIGCGGPTNVASTTGGGLEEDEEEAPRPIGPASASGSSEARALVGAAGGTLSLTNGARLEIPAGALTDAVEVVLRHGAEGQAFGDRETQRALGPMLNIEPALRSEGPPFVVSVPEQPVPNGWSTEDLAFAMEEVDDQQRAIDVLGTQTRWQFYHVRVEGGRLAAHTTGLPGHRVQFGVAR